MVKTIFLTSISFMVISTFLLLGAVTAFTFDFNSYAVVMSLKDQIKSSDNPDHYVCWNMDYVLTQRPNEEYVCVFPYTAMKLDWEIFPKYALTPMETKNGNFTIFNHFSRGSLTNMTISENNYSLFINFSTGESGKLSIKIPVNLIGSTSEDCFPKSSYPNYYPFIIFGTGEEVNFEQRLTTETFRYLEIPYAKDSTKIEIVGSCLS